MTGTEENIRRACLSRGSAHACRFRYPFVRKEVGSIRKKFEKCLVFYCGLI